MSLDLDNDPNTTQNQKQEEDGRECKHPISVTMLNPRPFWFCDHFLRELTHIHRFHDSNDKIIKTIGPFSFHREIANGCFGRVYEASLCCFPMRFAAKLIDTQHKRFSIDLLRREVGILRTLQHRNVIQFYDVIEVEDHYLLLTELAQGKDLYYWLEEEEEKMTYDLEFKCYLSSESSFHERVHIFKEIVSGVSYLWQQGIAHRDLKLENVLYSGRTVKICDFGMSIFLKDKEEELHRKCGSLHYVSGEVLTGSYQAESSTVWALGVTMYALFSKEFPFQDIDTPKVFELISKGEYKPIIIEHHFKMSPGSRNGFNWLLQDLLGKMLHVNPKCRFTLKQILEHPFLNDRHSLTSQSDSKIISRKNKKPQNKRSLSAPLNHVNLSHLQIIKRKTSRKIQEKKETTSLHLFPLKCRRKLCDIDLLLTVWTLLSNHVPTGADLYFLSFLVSVPSSPEYKLYKHLLQNITFLRQFFTPINLVVPLSPNCLSCLRNKEEDTHLLSRIEHELHRFGLPENEKLNSNEEMLEDFCLKIGECAIL